MDFTYFIALALSIVIGAIGAIIFVARRGESKRRLLGWATLASVVVDFLVLIDWSRVGEFPLVWQAFDFIFFAAYGLVGVSIGALTVLVISSVFLDLT